MRAMPFQVRPEMEQVFGADFSTVRLYESPIALAFGALAFTTGEHIVFAPGTCNPGTFNGRTLLGHELAHVVQQRQQRVVSAGKSVSINSDAGLEEEASWAGHRAARGLSVRLGAAAASAHRSGARVIQRLIINIGDTRLNVEYRRTNGWIVAKDIFVAMSDRTEPQSIIELDDCSSAITLAIDENIYLQGHGSPGAMAADYGVGLIAKKLNRLTFPDGYKGAVRAYCCSAGTPDKDSVPFSVLREGVAELAAQLKVPNVSVTGAAGISLNCADYANGTRAIKNDGACQNRIFAEIARTRGPVDAAWATWVNTHIAPLIADDANPAGLALIGEGVLKRGAVKAHLISKSFYMALQTGCAGDLIESGADLTTKKTGGGGRPRARSL